MRVQHVQRHLHGVEPELLLCGNLQRPQVDDRVLVPGETDVSDLTGLLRLQHGCHRAVFGEDAIRVFHSNDLMMLHQVDAVRLQALQAFVNLFGRELLRAPVNLRHQEHLVAVTIAQRFAHPDFAPAVVIIPAVVHEADAAIDGAADDADAFPLVFGHADMKPAQSNGGNLLARSAQRPVNHFARFRFRGPCLSFHPHSYSCGRNGSHEVASRHVTAFRSRGCFANASAARLPFVGCSINHKVPLGKVWHRLPVLQL